jgi:hypothetical protein
LHAQDNEDEADIEAAMERLHDVDGDGQLPEIHLRAVRDMALQMRTLPTSASALAWSNWMRHHNLIHGLHNLAGENIPELAAFVEGYGLGHGNGGPLDRGDMVVAASDGDASDFMYESTSDAGSEDSAEAELWTYLRVRTVCGTSVTSAEFACAAVCRECFADGVSEFEMPMRWSTFLVLHCAEEDAGWARLWTNVSAAAKHGVLHAWRPH